MRKLLGSFKRVIFEGEVLPDPERRELLQAASTLIWTGLAVFGAALVGAGFLRSPQRQGFTGRVRLADLSELQETPQLFQAEIEEQAGWRQVRKRLMVYARRAADGEVSLLSPVCSHLSCLVRWNEDGREFHCPCHNGRFSIEGRPLSGPPREPLRSPTFEIQRNAVYLKVTE